MELDELADSVGVVAFVSQVVIDKVFNRIISTFGEDKFFILMISLKVIGLIIDITSLVLITIDADDISSKVNDLCDDYYDCDAADCNDLYSGLLLWMTMLFILERGFVFIFCFFCCWNKEPQWYFHDANEKLYKKTIWRCCLFNTSDFVGKMFVHQSVKLKCCYIDTIDKQYSNVSVQSIETQNSNVDDGNKCDKCKLCLNKWLNGLKSFVLFVIYLGYCAMGCFITLLVADINDRTNVCDGVSESGSTATHWIIFSLVIGLLGYFEHGLNMFSSFAQYWGCNRCYCKQIFSILMTLFMLVALGTGLYMLVLL